MPKRSRSAFELSNSSSSSSHSSSANTTNSPPLSPPTKILHLSPSAVPFTTPAIHSSLPNQAQHLPLLTLTAYTEHYTTAHLHRCLSCHANFPSAHLLALHLTETHDPLAAIRRERGEKIYACFVEGCERKFWEGGERMGHAVGEHGLTRGCEGGVLGRGMGGMETLLGEEGRGMWEGRWRESRTVGKKGVGKDQTRDAWGAMNVDQKEARPAQLTFSSTEATAAQRPVAPQLGRTAPQPGRTAGTEPRRTEDAMEIDDLAASMSALRFVPPSVRFSRPKPRMARHS